MYNFHQKKHPLLNQSLHPFTNITTFWAFLTSKRKTTSRCVFKVYPERPEKLREIASIWICITFQATTVRSSVTGRIVLIVEWRTRAVRGTGTARTTTAVSRAHPGGWSVTRDGCSAPFSPTSTKTEALGEGNRGRGRAL